MNIEQRSCATSLPRAAVTAVVLGAIGAYGGFVSPSAAADDTDANQANASPNCEMEELDVPDSQFDHYVTDMDAQASYIAGNAHNNDGSNQRMPWVFHDGQAEYIDAPYDHAILTAINSSGTGVGYSDGPERQDVPWIYEDGEVTELPDMKNFQLEDINEGGDIVGNKVDPFVIRAGETEPTFLELPDEAEEGRVNGINDDGVAVGWFVTPENNDWENPLYEPYMWDEDGNGTKLALPGDEPFHSFAQSIQDDWITGYPALRWNLDGDDEPQPEEIDGMSLAHHTSPSGMTAGAVDVDEGYGYQAVLATPDGTVELPSLKDPDGDAFSYGLRVSEDGHTVVGTSEGPDGLVHAMSWTCK